jgi:hypothetical protein
MPGTTIQDTTDELDKKIKEAEALEAKPELDDEPITEESDDENDNSDNSDSDTSDDIETSEAEEVEETEEVEEEKTTEPVEEVDGHNQSYKDKFFASTREALVQKSQRERQKSKLEEANNLPTPSEEELKAEYPQWGDLDDFQKKIATEALHSKKYRAIISSITEEDKKKDEWLDKSAGFLEDPKTLDKFPQLRGREKDFLKFVSIDSRTNMDLNDAVAVFSYGLSQTEKSKHKGSLMNTGNGGVGDSNKTKLDIKDIKSLRQRDAVKYQEMVASGKIDPLADL